MNTKLQVKQLSKQFGNVHALRDITIDVKEGDMLAVLGESGCGKTTLLRSIAGFEDPDHGEIKIDGEVVFDAKTNVAPDKRKIGYVPQEGMLFPHLTVKQNIAFGLTRKERKSNRVQEMLALVNMQGYENRMPNELSGGQQQRIALARAIAPNPKLVLLDEPFSALDAGLRTTLRAEVKRMLKRVNATSIFVTHDQEEALSMADSTMILVEGRNIQEGTPTMIYYYPNCKKIADFVGDVVYLDGQIEGDYFKGSMGHLEINEVSQSEGSEAKVMIRPEQLEISNDDTGIEATVQDTDFFGHDSLVYLDIKGIGRVKTRILGACQYEVEDKVNVKINGKAQVIETTV
ncbi:ABC transporter ATP-binding protein [Staphylococcus pettenkoferi]|uniref:ABC transporter ATP-binding protein n=1 Tax=Staphylococcus pettenkoferi TaxID=170573 RepID=UPI0022747D7B|nr:ABC transporter ATP-binding protein [Staphylococcus pettenkoferi]MCY1593258.1 ABC transporter ATP-binding protein [Staphylococcus pettenkoferi]MCY1610334.1 ABC transporter ATP-binding protein [Staphylococcus pettenkoferi]MCY1625394.1 ABC transporter ATP-binding protein [Staphylococcus pettenkoferi]